LLCRCAATGAVIQFFQKCKWSRNEQNHVWEGVDDSYTVRSRQTHREREKQIYIKSTNDPSDKHHICPAKGPRNGPRRKGHPIVVPLPSNRSRNPNFPKNVSGLGTNKTMFGKAVMIPIRSAAIRLTERQTKLYIRSTEGCRPSSNFSKNVSRHGFSEQTERKTKTNNVRTTSTYVPPLRTYLPNTPRKYHPYK
jgi:hypothetical protein